MLFLIRWWKPIAIGLAVASLLATAYLKGKAACEAKIVQEKVVVYEKAQSVKNGVSKLPDGDAMRVLRKEWQRGV